MRQLAGSIGPRLGVVIPQVGRWRAVEEQFRWAEEIGYDVACVYDHLTHPTLPGEWLADAFTTLGAAAVATSRIGPGTLVASAILHSPVSLARRAGTVQDVSGGRWCWAWAPAPRAARPQTGGEDPTPREMLGRLRDVVAGMQAVWDGATECTGEIRSFRGLQTTPLYGTVRPTTSAEAYRDAVHRAAELGFHELVLYGPGSPGGRFQSDAETHAAALSEIRAVWYRVS